MDWSWAYIGSLVLLALGFGFVIFWHELGHFLAAKWAGVKVEQFAVGFGTAAIAWRKGIGVRLGSTRPEYEKRCNAYLASHEGGVQTNIEIADATTSDQRLDAAGRALGLGETEYRLNWLPLGGYVKMLGQDDMNPNAIANDPRAYNMKPIGKRMVIVSAGVIMNIILAAIGFSLLFGTIGFNASAPIVGSMQPLSPAQVAGLNVGDRILRIDGAPQADFSKIQLAVALIGADEEVSIDYLPAGAPAGSSDFKTLKLRPSSRGNEMRGMFALGIGGPRQLAAIDADPKDDFEKVSTPNLISPSLLLVRPGETIVRVGDEPINDPVTEYWKLDRALQASNGKTFNITVRTNDKKEDVRQVEPTFEPLFGKDDLDFGGMLPRMQISTVMDKSPAKDKLMPDDIVVAIARSETGDEKQNPTRQALTELLNRSGQDDKPIVMTVQRKGEAEPVKLQPIIPSVKVNKREGKMGLGVVLSPDEANAIVAGVVENSPAGRAGIPAGARIVSIDGKPVKDWREAHTLFKNGSVEQPFSVVARSDAGEKTYNLRLSDDDLAQLRRYRYTFGPAEMGILREQLEERRAANIGQAINWGVVETRDLMTQFYLTLKRMVQRTVPASNLMGPVGIVQFGSRFAMRGSDYLIWFLSMISANLAVVNFLPIPIVDGGLFVFLIIEKLQGKPLSARAQSIAQVAGLALIASVFIFVTYQDIMR